MRCSWPSWSHRKVEQLEPGRYLCLSAGKRSLRVSGIPVRSRGGLECRSHGYSARKRASQCWRVTGHFPGEVDGQRHGVCAAAFALAPATPVPCITRSAPLPSMHLIPKCITRSSGLTEMSNCRAAPAQPMHSASVTALSGQQNDCTHRQCGRGQCPESVYTMDKFRFLHAVRTHLATARYVLSATHRP
ncbi:hypothetical protein NBC2815_01792 [Xanthomonas fragariae]|nr:hypothetical protein NBC2815_01792 [Xanthomonas fragariae]